MEKQYLINSWPQTSVSQKLYYLGEEVGNAERLSALEEESSLKKESRRVCLGFSAA